jgi:hypothetical protein
MRLSQSYISSHEFNGLTRVDSGHFLLLFLIIFFASPFTIELFDN